MSKYDVGSIKLGMSHKIILEQIEEGSTVLECGCATGYMTQYMKENLNCRVYIIEYDSDGFSIAMNYAEDGICCDLTKDDWMVKFRGMKFDYILFADVLEHLSNPSMVLRKAVALLKNEGKLIVSLPNVAHNDIIANLYNDNWKYTDLGLLDNTHIKFWGRKNLEALFVEAGLKITRIRYNIHGMNRTEQKAEYGNDNVGLTEVLEKRPYGSVYQFIITAQRQSFCEEHGIETEEEKLKTEPYQYTVYYGDSLKFVDTKKIVGSFGSDGRLDIDIDNTELKAKCLRFDPVEGFYCVADAVEITLDGVKSAIEVSNGMQCDGSWLFKTTDPQISIANIGENVKNIHISAKVTPMIVKSQLFMMDKVKMLYDKNLQLNKNEDSLNCELKLIKSQNQEDVEKLNKKIEELQRKVEEEGKRGQELEEKYREVLEETDKMQNTLSWKITGPFRKIRNLFAKSSK